MSRIGRRRVLVAALAAAAVAGAVGAGVASGEPSGPPSPAEVRATQDALDARAPSVPDSVVSWGVDPAVGLVVVGVRGARDGEVDRFLVGLDPRTYRVQPGTEQPRPLPQTAPAG